MPPRNATYERWRIDQLHQNIFIQCNAGDLSNQSMGWTTVSNNNPEEASRHDCLKMQGCCSNDDMTIETASNITKSVDQNKQNKFEDFKQEFFKNMMDAPQMKQMMEQAYQSFLQRQTKDRDATTKSEIEIQTEG